MARAAYRAVNGELILSSVQSTVHPLNETDGSVNLAGLSYTSSVKRALANDVTACGENEPVAYVTEYFLGDGVATQFNLAADPYFPQRRNRTSSASSSTGRKSTRISGALQLAPVISRWAQGALRSTEATGSTARHCSPGSDPVEMGGNASAGSSGSDNLALLEAPEFLPVSSAASETAAECAVGFQATAQQGTGAVTLQPIVEGTPAGTTFAVSPANQYALRVRVYCPEFERSHSIYYSFGDSGPIAAGGDSVLAPARDPNGNPGVCEWRGRNPSYPL